jgi:hypothetical protein
MTEEATTSSVSVLNVDWTTSSGPTKRCAGQPQLYHALVQRVPTRKSGHQHATHFLGTWRPQQSAPGHARARAHDRDRGDEGLNQVKTGWRTDPAVSDPVLSLDQHAA